MDSVEIIGGILGENFAFKFEPPEPEKEIVEIRIEDIQSDDDDLEDCDKSDIKENYCVQDEPIFIRQDRVPAVFRETLINVNDRTDNGTETKSDSDCEIIGVLEGKDKESKNNLVLETKSKDPTLSYQKHCQENIGNNRTNYFPKPRLKKIIQEQPVANTGSLLFSLLSKGSANRENIQTVAGYRKEKVVSGDLEINKRKEKTINSDIGKSKAYVNSQDRCCSEKSKEETIAGGEKSLLFSLLTGKKGNTQYSKKNHESNKNVTLQGSSFLCLSEPYNEKNNVRSNNVQTYNGKQVNKIQTQPVLYGLLSNPDEQFKKNLRNTKAKKKKQKKSVCNNDHTREVMLRLSNSSKEKNNYKNIPEVQKQNQVRTEIDKSILYHWLLQNNPKTDNNQSTSCIKKQGKKFQRQQNNMTVPLEQVLVLSSDDETLENPSTRNTNSFLQSKEISNNKGLLEQENNYKQQKKSIENKAGHSVHKVNKNAKELLEYRMNIFEEPLFGPFMLNPETIISDETEKSSNQIKDPWQKQLNYNKRKNDIRNLLEQTKRNSLKTQEEYRLLLQNSNLDKQKMKHSKLQVPNVVPSVIQNMRNGSKYDHSSKGIHERQLNKVLCNSSKNKGHIETEIFEKNNKSENQNIQNNKGISCKTDYKNNFMQSESKGKQEKELNGQSKKEYGKNKQSVKEESTDEDPFNCSSDDDGGNFEDDLDLDLTRKTLQKKAQPTRRNIIVSSTADDNRGVFEVNKLSNDSQEANRKQGKNHIKESKEGEKGKSKEVIKKVIACARQDIITISNTSDNNKGESWPEKSSEATSKERRHEKILENSEKVVKSALVINSSDNNYKKSCDDSNQEKSWLNESSHDDQGAYRLQKKNSVKNGKGEKNKGLSEKMAASPRQTDTDTNYTNDVKYDEDKRKEGKEGGGKELELPEKLVASAMQAVIDNSTIDNDNHDECLPDALNNDYQESNKIQKNKIVKNDKEEEKEVSIVEEPATHLSNGNNIADNNNHNKSLPDESSNGDQQSNEISKKDSAENDKKAEDKKNKAVSEKSEKISASARQNVIDNSSTNNVNYNEGKRKEGPGEVHKLVELPENIDASAVQAIIDDSCNDDDNHDESWPDASNNDYQEGNHTQEKNFGINIKKVKEVSKVGESARQHLTGGNSIGNNNHKKSWPDESSNDDQQTNKINKKDFIENNKKAEDRTNKEVSEQIAASPRHDGIAHSDANDNHDESWPDKSINDNQDSNDIQKRTFIKKSKRGEKRKHEVLENIAAYAKEAVINIYDSDDNNQDDFVRGETGEKRKLEALSSKTENCTKKGIREHILLSKSIQIESETVNQNQGVNRILKVAFNIKNSKSDEKNPNELCKTKKIIGFEESINKSVNLTKPAHKQKNRKEAKKKYKRKEVPCPHCSHVIKKDYLKEHILIKHTDEKNINYLRCHQCEYKAKTKSRLRNHIIYKHTEPENMMEDMKKCDQCPKMFKIASELKVHKRNVHNKKQKIEFQCANCNFKTVVKHTLRRHMEEHIYPERILSCPDCSFTTNSKIKAIRHKNTVHSTQMFQCHVCAYKTKYSDHMKKHLISHKEVKDDKDLTLRCDKCDYKTYRHYSLQVHKMKHLKDNEIEYFYCKHCEFKTKRKDNLKVHVSKHFLHYKCYICDFTTSMKSLLINHIGEHSKD